MLIKKIGQNKYRKANLFEKLNYFVEQHEVGVYTIGSCVVGAILFVFNFYIFGGR